MCLRCLALLVAAFSGDIQRLLRLIRDGQPKSRTELAGLSSRKVPNRPVPWRLMTPGSMVQLRVQRQGRPPNCSGDR